MKNVVRNGNFEALSHWNQFDIPLSQVMTMYIVLCSVGFLTARSTEIWVCPTLSHSTDKSHSSETVGNGAIRSQTEATT